LVGWLGAQPIPLLALLLSGLNTYMQFCHRPELLHVQLAGTNFEQRDTRTLDLDAVVSNGGSSSLLIQHIRLSWLEVREPGGSVRPRSLVSAEAMPIVLGPGEIRILKFSGPFEVQEAFEAGSSSYFETPGIRGLDIKATVIVNSSTGRIAAWTKKIGEIGVTRDGLVMLSPGRATIKVDILKPEDQ
jgi:hypothetical protein